MIFALLLRFRARSNHKAKITGEGAGRLGGMGSATFLIRVRSSARPAQVFALLADAPSWAEWAGPTVPQARWEVGTPAGVGAVRRLGAGPLTVREQVVVHEPPTAFSYVLLTGVRWHGYRADVVLTPDGAGTAISWAGRLSSPVPGLAGLLAPGFRALVADYAQRLTVAAEWSTTG